MSLSIKISPQSKARIAKIQSQLFLAWHIKATQTEILDFLVDLALGDEEIIERIRQAKVGKRRFLQEQKWAAMFDNPPDYGIADLSEKIDEEIVNGFEK